MQVTQEQISPCEIELQVEVEVEKVDLALEESYREFARVTSVPGFRKGKAPRAVLERYVDEEKLKDHAADKLVKPAFIEALEETKIEAFAPADVELVTFEQGQPLVFKARVPLAPKIELGDYVGLEIERSVEEVTDEALDSQIHDILMRHASYDLITDRPVEMEDTLVLDLKDDAGENDEPRRSVIDVGSNVEQFDKGLIGMNLDEERDIEVVYGDDAEEELRGKTIHYWVKLIEINRRHVPELTDEWVKEHFAPQPPEGEEPPAEPPADQVDTVEKLRNEIRSAMEKAARDVADLDVRNRIMSKLVENSQVDFPDVMVRERVADRFHELTEDLKKRKATLDQYLEHAGVSLDELREHYEQEARRTLTNALVIRQIVDNENLEVGEEEIDDEIANMAAERRVPTESMRAYVEATDSTDQIRSRLLHRKAMDFLVHASNIKTVGAETAKS